MVMDNQTNSTVGNLTTTIAGNGNDLIACNVAYAKKVTAAVVYLAVIMVLGIVGNSMVCLVYCCKRRKCVTHRFIISLALLDLTSCMVIIPVEIVKMHFNCTFGTYGYWCKTYRLMYAFFTISGCGLLIVIAADRYRKICKPFKRQTTLRMARNIILICLLLSSSISLPAFFLNCKHSVEENDTRGFVCNVTDEFKQSYLPFAYNGTLLVLHFTGCFILVVLYVLIWKRLTMQRMFRLMLGNSLRRIRFSKETRLLGRRAPSQDNLVENSSTSSIQTSIDQYEKTSHRFTEKSGQKTSQRSTEAPLMQEHRLKKKTSFLEFHRTTFVMLVVTVLFVVSFIPFFSLVVLSHINHDLNERIKLSHSGLYNLFIRFHFLNSAMNPIVYSFFGTQFRKNLTVTCNNIFKRK